MTPSQPPRFIDSPETDSPAVFDEFVRHGQLAGALYECLEHGCGHIAVLTDGAYSDRTVGWRIDGKLIQPATRPIPDWFTDTDTDTL